MLLFDPCRHGSSLLWSRRRYNGDFDSHVGAVFLNYCVTAASLHLKFLIALECGRHLVWATMNKDRTDTCK